MIIEVGPSHDGPSLTQWALAIAAVLSSVVSALSVLVQHLNNSRQVTAALSANRQNWIDDVRTEVASVFSALWTFKSNDDGLSALAPHFTSEHEIAARDALCKLRVLLDTGQSSHRDLLGLVQIAVTANMIDSEMEGLIAKAVQTIVSIELDKMRRGK